MCKCLTSNGIGREKTAPILKALTAKIRMTVLNLRNDAYKLLDELGAPSHLKTHVRLVGEAADLLIHKLTGIGLKFDSEFVRIGVAIHDIEKIKYQNEMIGSGSEHEPEGEKILLELGVESQIACVCMSHARFALMDCSIEELIIALSDKLWKGKRVEELELKVIDSIASLMGKDRWDVYPELDQQFELITSSGHERLQRSISS
ncbi:hypothetical protein [Simiduia litorea]|uniref:hypothetical protein n=1 Tax=Simiduia litorea TaxID=1435348 RepID=UPI0036F28677